MTNNKEYGDDREETSNFGDVLREEISGWI